MLTQLQALPPTCTSVKESTALREPRAAALDFRAHPEHIGHPRMPHYQRDIGLDISFEVQGCAVS